MSVRSGTGSLVAPIEALVRSLGGRLLRRGVQWFVEPDALDAQDWLAGSAELVGPADDIGAERRQLRRVVQELRRLDAERGEPLLDLGG